MWKNLFLNDLSGLEISLPQFGHLAMSTAQVQYYTALQRMPIT